MANAPVETVPLGYGMTLSCTFPDLDAVKVVVRFRNHRLFQRRFSAKKQGKVHRLNVGFVRFGFGCGPNMFDGEVTWTCTVDVRKSPRSTWRRVFDREQRVLFRFDPSIGEVAGRTEACPPQVDSATFGASQPCSPAILRFHVNDVEREVCKVGSIVKRQMFPDHPPFVFNTVACVGAFRPPGAPGPYADPSSAYWFNVFVGYYQLDCLKSEWSRPFGYEKAEESRSTVVPEDLVRLGKSDWNWFSNWCYGVPADALLATSAVPSALDAVVKDLVKIGNGYWHEVEINGTEVASCYESDAPGAEKLQWTSDVWEAWRRSFGAPRSRPSFPESFIPVRVDAVIDMSYWEDDEAYHTVIFGGTAHAGANPEFLQTQLQATRAVITSEYPDLGFE
jgi:hypothetical protein